MQKKYTFFLAIRVWLFAISVLIFLLKKLLFLVENCASCQRMAKINLIKTYFMQFTEPLYLVFLK